MQGTANAVLGVRRKITICGVKCQAKCDVGGCWWRMLTEPRMRVCGVRCMYVMRDA